MDKKTRIFKTFDTVFVLNKSKAVRINDIIETHLKKSSIISINRTFKLSLNNDKEMIFQDFNSIFDIDNGKKNQIERLKLSWTNEDITIDISFKSDPSINVDISSSGIEWTNQLFAEIEEQIERITLSDWFYRFVKEGKSPLLFVQAISVLFVMLFYTFFTVLSPSKNTIYKDNLNLTNTEKTKLLNKADSIKSNDEKLDFIFTTIKQMVKIDQEKPEPVPKDVIVSFITNYKNYTIIIPILFCIILVWYVLQYCYPKYVFEWGDMADEFAKLVERRKLIWNIIIGSFVLGAVTNLFVWGLTT